MFDDKLQSVSEAAFRLGRSVNWVRGALKQRKISYVKLGGRKYIPESFLGDVFTIVPAKESSNTP